MSSSADYHSLYVDVILPLPLAGTFTYSLPASLNEGVQVGSRVIVPFGVRRFYTAIVVRKHGDEPTGDYVIKAVEEVIDDAPIVLPEQLRLWQWMADYYMCTIGDVYKAALPSGLKVESETIVELDGAFADTELLSDDECQVLQTLSAYPKRRIDQLTKLCGPKTMRIVRSLLEKGAVCINESLRYRYKPKQEAFVKLAEGYAHDEIALHLLLGALSRAPKQKLLLETFLQHAGHIPGIPGADMRRSELLEMADATSTHLNALVKRGVLTVEWRDAVATNTPRETATVRHKLSDTQQTAKEAILNVWDLRDVCLLHGVTSSGKTEVYIDLIDEQLRQGKQVLYMVPEIALTQQMTDRLRRALGDRLGVYHSKFSDAERAELWKKQLSEHPYDVVLGVRSSVFLPFRRLGMVIVDEEHEATYKQQDPAPRYHARNVAIVLASFYHAKTLLGTATPSFESYFNALKGKYGLVEMTKRFSEVQLPHIEVVDIKEERRKKRMNGPFSLPLYDAMKSALEEGEQIILFQNRRGYAPMIECPDCGWVPKCDCCDVSLTLHQKQNRLVCHYCGNTYQVPQICPKCGGKSLYRRGIGTERIEEEVRRYFPKAKVARMDLDTTRSKQAYEKILTDFQAGETDILIGTQMVSKGLDFDHVHVVGIMNADGMLSYPDFRAYERAFQLMAQVAGRAGRRGRQGLVVLQTKSADVPVIQQVVEHDYLQLYTDQMMEREAFHYPPFSRLIFVYVKGRDEQTVSRVAVHMAEGMRRYWGPNVLGPEAPAVARVQALYIQKIMLKLDVASTGIAQVRQSLRYIQQQLSDAGELGNVTLYYDVDPM